MNQLTAKCKLPYEAPIAVMVELIGTDIISTSDTNPGELLEWDQLEP